MTGQLITLPMRLGVRGARLLLHTAEDVTGFALETTLRAAVALNSLRPGQHHNGHDGHDDFEAPAQERPRPQATVAETPPPVAARGSRDTRPAGAARGSTGRARGGGTQRTAPNGTGTRRGGRPAGGGTGSGAGSTGTSRPGAGAGSPRAGRGTPRPAPAPQAATPEPDPRIAERAEAEPMPAPPPPENVPAPDRTLDRGSARGAGGEPAGGATTASAPATPAPAPEGESAEVVELASERLRREGRTVDVDLESPPSTEPAHVSEEPTLVREEAERGAEDGAGASVHVREPWDGYDRMNVRQVIGRLDGASPAELAAVQLYETSRRRRQTVLQALERQSKNRPS